MFLESIGFVDGEAPLMEYHRRRVTKTLWKEKNLKENNEEKKTLIEASINIMIFFLSALTPPSSRGRFKCRVLYDPYQIEKKTMKFTPYQPTPIRTLQMVDGGDIVYDCKYSDRKQINDLFNRKGKADDILIVKNDMITDTSYCNIIFFDGKEWITPDALLMGVQRTYLLDTKKIRVSPVKVDHLNRFQSFKLINALRNFEEVEEIPVENIFSGDNPII